MDVKWYGGTEDNLGKPSVRLASLQVNPRSPDHTGGAASTHRVSSVHGEVWNQMLIGSCYRGYVSDEYPDICFGY
jgi:hypothetical protein